MSDDPNPRSPTADQLSRYLFGAPWDPADVGIIGRQSQEIAQLRKDWEEETKVLRKLVGRMVFMGWSLFGLMLTGMVTLVVDLINRGTNVRIP